MIKVLVVEDDPNMGFLIKENLRLSGYESHHSIDGQKACEQIEKDHFDLFLLDVMLPEKDGFDLARFIRQRDKETPIIFLTAKSFPEDKIKGFKLGADDYICKPFDIEELLLRISAILRRSNKSTYQKDILEIGNVSFDMGERQIRIGLDAFSLSEKESQLLYLFFSNRGEVVSRKNLLEDVWDRDDFFTSKSLDIYIYRLRKLLTPASNLKLQNVYGLGYKLVLKEE